MDVLYLIASEADNTRRSITMLIFALLFVSFALFALTVWYWKYTSPKRYISVDTSNTKDMAPHIESLYSQAEQTGEIPILNTQRDVNGEYV